MNSISFIPYHHSFKGVSKQEKKNIKEKYLILFNYINNNDENNLNHRNQNKNGFDENTQCFKW